jgi:hypothetical protein
MGSFRFRRQIKLLPGVKLNINKKSTSVTVGGRGAHVTYNTNGQRTTSVGLPGTGLSWRDTRNVRRGGAQPAREQATAWWVNDDGIPATPNDPQELGSVTVNGTEIKAVCFGPYDCRLMVEVSDGVWGTAGQYRTPEECGAAAREVQAFLLGGGTIRGGEPPKDQTVTGHIGMGTVTNQKPE